MTDYKSLLLEIHDQVWNPVRDPAVERFYATTFRNHNPGAPHIVDRDGVRQYALDTAAGFPDYTITPFDMIVEGDRLALRYAFRGTHTGSFAGLPATGNRVDATGVCIYRFTGDLVAECWWNQDSLTFLQQLGVVPSLAPA